jgi:hypothetical protein
MVKRGQTGPAEWLRWYNYLSSKHEALSSNPSITNNNKKKGQVRYVAWIRVVKR